MRYTINVGLNIEVIEKKRYNKNMKKKIKLAIIVASFIPLLFVYTSKQEEIRRLTEIGNSIGFYADQSFDLQSIIDLKYPTIILYGRSTCLSCVEASRELLTVSKDVSNSVIIKYVDVFKYPEIDKQFNVKLSPTIYFYNQGVLIKEFSGVMSVAQIKQIIEDMGVNFE